VSQAYHCYALNYINALNYLETLRRHVEFCEFEKVRDSIRVSCASFCLVGVWMKLVTDFIIPLNAELNPICHLLALLGAHHILHVSGLRVK